MALKPKVWKLRTAVSVIAIAGCRSPSSSAPAPERCGPRVPASAQHPLAIPPRALAGDYELIQVQSQPVAGVVSLGRLHLSPLDSVARAGAVGGAARDLIGWLDPARGDSAWRAIAASRDPAHPGAALAGQHLRVGEVGNLEGYREHLTITAVAPEGFWGWWKGDPGLDARTDAQTGRALPDPAGYFCALRVRP
jgi:hypothetical protein